MACRGYPFWAPDEKALAQRERRAEVAAAGGEVAGCEGEADKVWHARSFTLVKSRHICEPFLTPHIRIHPHCAILEVIRSCGHAPG